MTLENFAPDPPGRTRHIRHTVPRAASPLLSPPYLASNRNGTMLEPHKYYMLARPHYLGNG